MAYKKSSKFSQKYILALLNNPAVYFKSIYKLLRGYFSPQELMDAPASKLRNFGVDDEVIAFIKKPDWRFGEEALEWAEKDGHHIMLATDEDYSPLLNEIANPPQLLFVEGDHKLLAKNQLAIVGSRNPTLIGKETAFNFAKELSRRGLVITSGLATGIDGASHEGALAGGGFTVAVMGTGLGMLYPPEHRGLANKIVASGGALVSEFPLMTKGARWHFPLRNRIISGLSLGTLVVEAGIKSGSLITANFAADQGREVFAIPGSIYNPLAKGCHYLISHGAKLVETPDDICIEYEERNYNNREGVNDCQEKSDQKNILDHYSQKLLECVGFEATPVEVLIDRTNFSAKQIGSLLLQLELRGYLKKTAIGYERINAKRI